MLQRYIQEFNIYLWFLSVVNLHLALSTVIVHLLLSFPSQIKIAEESTVVVHDASMYLPGKIYRHLFNGLTNEHTSTWMETPGRYGDLGTLKYSTSDMESKHSNTNFLKNPSLIHNVLCCRYQRSPQIL